MPVRQASCEPPPSGPGQLRAALTAQRTHRRSPLFETTRTRSPSDLLVSTGARIPPDGTGAELASHLAAVSREIAARLKNPSSRPPAWLWFLEHAYSIYPPPAFSSERCAAELARVRGISAADTTAIAAALKVAVVAYHPDKNRPEARGVRGAVMAEELAKHALTLQKEYKARTRAADIAEVGGRTSMV